MQKLTIIKIGGNVIDNASVFAGVLRDIAAMPGERIVVHGGGKLATELAGKLNIPQTMVDGRRVTNAETLDIAIMVYAGLINKKLVTGLQYTGTNAIGLCGADARTMVAERRKKGDIDYGYVGDLEAAGVNAQLLGALLGSGLLPVLSPVTYSPADGLLNTNADTIAAAVAVAMSELRQVELVYSMDKPGVLLDSENDSSLIEKIDREAYGLLVKQGVISGGMIPKLDRIFYALQHGVSEIRICAPQHLSGTYGTRFTN